MKSWAVRLQGTIRFITIAGGDCGQRKKSGFDVSTSIPGRDAFWLWISGPMLVVSTMVRTLSGVSGVAAQHNTITIWRGQISVPNSQTLKKCAKRICWRPEYLLICLGCALRTPRTHNGRYFFTPTFISGPAYSMHDTDLVRDLVHHAEGVHVVYVRKCLSQNTKAKNEKKNVSKGINDRDNAHNI